MEIEQAQIEKQAALQREQAALQKMQSMQTEIERLKALLAQSNQTP